MTLTSNSSIIPFKPNTTSRQGGEIAQQPLHYRWFRFENDTINDPKILRLSAEVFRVWVSLMCVSSKHNGPLPSLDDTAVMLRMTPKKLEAAIKTLMSSGILEEVEGAIQPANWDEMQYKSDSSAERMRRHRQRHRDVTVTGIHYNTEHNRTGQDTDRTGQDTTPEAEIKVKAANGTDGSKEEGRYGFNGGGRKEDSAKGVGGRKQEFKPAEILQAEVSKAAPRVTPPPPKPFLEAAKAARAAGSCEWDRGLTKPERIEVLLAAIPPERFHAELRGAAELRRVPNPNGWAAHRYKDKYGKFPPREWNDRPGADPSSPTLDWLETLPAYDAKSRNDDPDDRPIPF
jgi:hypothetical protein